MATNEDLERRFGYHAPNALRAELHQDVRHALWTAADAINRLCPDSRELSLALTKLEEAMYHANAAIARHEDA